MLIQRTVVMVALVLCACGPATSAVDSGIEGMDAGVDAGVDAGAPSCSAVPVTCGDQAVQELDYKQTVSDAGIIENGTVAGVFETYVDARGGGLAPTSSYTYARFTTTGLQRVQVSDEQAQTDTSWDIAFRRFVIRLNSGASGPSCVAGARTAPGTTFDQVTSVEPSLTFNPEQYFTATCDLVDDGTGLGAPATVLASFWSYASCLKMTGNVFVLRLADGRHVKAQVLSYYDPAPQAACDATGMVTQPSGAAQIRLRWSFL